MSTDIQIFEAAQNGDLERVKILHAHGGNINMAIMGATYEEKTSKEQSRVAAYAFEQGASLLFGLSRIQNNAPAAEVKPNSWFTRVKMVGGVGEVPAGTFKKKRERDS